MKTKLPTKNISTPLINDILLGRGGSSIHNDSNVRYRAMVREYKKEYQTYTRHQKTQLAERLVDEWQSQDPPGRFLEKNEKTGLWHCIPDKSARRKTSQLLREGAPKIRRQIKDESVMRKQQQEQQSQAQTFTNNGRSPPPALTGTENTPDRYNGENSATYAPPITPIRSTAPENGHTGTYSVGPSSNDVGPSSNDRPFFEYPHSHSYSAHRSPHRRYSYSPYPRTPPPSQSHFMTPPRWQPYPYHASNPAPVPTTPAPTTTTTTTVPMTPKTTAVTPTPLKPITPAHVNQKTPTIKSKTSSSSAHNIFIRKPPAVSRNNSCSSTGSSNSFGSKSKYYHKATLAKPTGITSPESVLEFFDLGETTSWDCSEIGGDVSALVEDLKSPYEPNNNTKFIFEREPLPLEPLSEVEEVCPDLPSMNALRKQNRKDSSSSSQQPQQSPFLSDTQIGSWEDVSLPPSSGERSSFDMMEQLCRAESDIDHTSTIDILNELDQQIEAEMLAPLCPSF